jgi:hypothetical protein
MTFSPGIPAGTPGSGGANLSAQDFFGIRLQIVTTGKWGSKLTWQPNSPSATVFHELGALSNFAVITLQNATGAIALGENGVPTEGVSGGDVVRVISPASVAPTDSMGRTVYPSLANYVMYLQTGPTVTNISGNNGQFSNGTFQTYDFDAIITNSDEIVDGVKIVKGSLLFQGNVNNGNGDIATVVVVPSANLTDHAIYGANPSYMIIKGDNTAHVVDRALADYFAALNFGFLGSTVDNPNMPGTAIGASPSYTWYGNQPNGINQPPLNITKAFDFAQHDHSERFNQYAAYLTDVSDAYGFAYNDRLQSPLAPLTDGSDMTVTILPDTEPLRRDHPGPRGSK